VMGGPYPELVEFRSLIESTLRGRP
jgi:hypothetical protein